jgi:hypothetical protein
VAQIDAAVDESDPGSSALRGCLRCGCASRGRGFDRSAGGKVDVIEIVLALCVERAQTPKRFCGRKALRRAQNDDAIVRG